MPFTLIKGTFRVVGYQPDGDSFKLHANNPGNWAKLDGRRPKPNAKGDVQLRFEAVDTLETHFQGVHQPLAAANQATDFNLTRAGFKNVVWGPKHRTVTGADDGVDGYILCRTTETYGRPVCFVFAGTTQRRDGSQVFLDPALLRQSINYKLLKAGLAYPMYYDGLFADLREVMTAAVKSARAAGLGVWPTDKSAGVTVNDLAAITDHHPILPKLFRRLAKYIKANGGVAGFHDALENTREAVLILPQAHKTYFDTVVSQTGNRIRMSVLPENLVFDS